MDDDRPAIELIADARERTLAAASARIELFIDHTREKPPLPRRPRRRRGGLMRPVRAIAKVAGKRLLRVVVGNFDFRHQSAEGVLDLDRRRYMLDYSSYARLYADGKEWDGRSGRLLATLTTDKDVVPTPLWLLDILAGQTAATDEGTEDVRGKPCRRLTATVDVSRASKLTQGGVAVPTLARFEDLLALPVEVWVDDQHVRRIRFRPEHHTETLELWDFGVPLDHLDWTCLPTFRSPEEAARWPRPGSAAEGHELKGTEDEPP